jgi:hypothetical protein
MNKNNVSNHKTSKNNSENKLTSTHLPNLMTNFTGNIEQAYLPKMRTDYSPNDESVESATGVDFPINMPNPATDSIVVNNIATQEFDYTQNVPSPEESDSK